MQTPVFKKAADRDSFPADISATKPLPTLAAVHIDISRLGLLVCRFGYAVFALSLLWVFYPFIIAQPLYLVGLVLCSAGLWWGYLQQLKYCTTGTLEFVQGHWCFERVGQHYQLELAAEVLCWSWVIILPLRDIASGKTQRLVIFSDALSRSDNARLRRWLRACLVPKG